MHLNLDKFIKIWGIDSTRLLTIGNADMTIPPAYLYHGNCLNAMSALPDESVDCVWTDPPYRLSNGGTTCVAGKRAPVDKGFLDRSYGVQADHEFNLAWLGECYRILKPTGSIWVSGSIHSYPSVGFAMQTLGFKILNDIVWQKPSPPPNLGCRCFTHSTEIILWANKRQKGKSLHTFNYEAMKQLNGGKQMKNLWTIPTPGNQEKQHGKHPTQKPVALISRCLRASTNLGELVFDPFAGSGTTGVAAMVLGRRFIGCEIDDDYIELARTRLQKIGDELALGYVHPA